MRITSGRQGGDLTATAQQAALRLDRSDPPGGVLPSITARSIALVVATWLATATAWAAPTLIPGQPIIADGRTTARLVLSVPGAKTGAKVKIKVPGGRLDEATVVAPGRVEARYMPDRVAEGTEIELFVIYGVMFTVLQQPDGEFRLSCL